MASPDIAAPMPKNEPLVNAIELSAPPRVKPNCDQRESKLTSTRKAGEANASEDNSPGVDRIIKELDLDLNRPLSHALRSVFKNGGKVVLAFPDSSYIQVKNVAVDIREKERSFPQSIISWVWSWIWPYELPDIDVKVVQILTTSVHHYISIIKYEIQEAISRIPDVDLVTLVSAETENEALTVDPHKGRVYYKYFNPNNQELDDTSLFFRVQFEPLDQSYKTDMVDNDDNSDDDIPRRVMIWINLKTLLPIGKDETDDKLYAFLPEMDITPPSFVSTTNPNDIPPNVAHPFHWLPGLAKGSSYQSVYFYRQHGPDESAAIYPASEPEPVVRISKGENDAAVIRASSMVFVAQHITIDGHTN